MMDGHHFTPPPMPPSSVDAEQAGCGPVSHLATPGELMAAIMLPAALWWAEARGLWVFPCEWGGKRPVVPRGFKSATRDRRRIVDWFEGRFSGHNIGARTGTPGDDVLDVDVRPDGSGWAAFNRLKQTGLLAGAHRLVRTPSGGLHVYFTGTSQRCGSLKAEHLDFKATGGYVLLPPSHVTGRPYMMVDDRPPTGAVLDWDAARRLLRPPRPAQPRAGGYSCPRPRRAGRVDHLPDWLAEQAEGNRNASLFWAACRAAEAGDQDLLAELVAAAVLAGLDEAEAQRTVASAVRTVNGDGR
jgi:hypothetical protein